MTTPLLQIDDLRIAYGPITAVDGVGFTIQPGEQVSLLGPSGCGKTTTLRAVAGLEHPVGGRIAIAGQAVFDAAARIDLPPERRGLSMVFQSYAIWPHMTVFENVAFPFRIRRRPAAETKEAVARALALVDLAGYADRPATALSGGQQQRVALARALAFQPNLVLFDEPLSNLDARLRLLMRDELAELRRRIGFTALYVTHDQEEAFSLSDRIVVMHAGRIEQSGRPAEIHDSPRTRFVASFLGVRNILDAAVSPPGADATGTARLADGTVLAARDPHPEPGDAPAIAFRPGDVTLSEDPATPGQGGQGRVVRSLFTGDHQHVFLRDGPIEICAQLRPRPGLEEGRLLSWRVAPGDCLILRK